MPRVKSLLQKNSTISANSKEASADLSCIRKDFSKAQGVNDLVVSINCEVKLTADGVNLYDIEMESTGLGSTAEKAYKQARKQP